MINGERKFARPIRWAMVGGGRGSNIGYIHRSAALRDRTFELVAGAFDIDPERGKDFGAQLGLDPDRCYPDYETLFAEEAKRTDGIEAVSIATPNSTHYKIAKAALQAGLHVVVEKPLCFETEQAAELVELSRKLNRVVGVTYGYSGHQMIEQARQMVQKGDLGDIRLIQMEFSHGFSVSDDKPGQNWRVDPKVAGPSFVLGDVGTHPLFLSEVIVPDLKIKRLLCTRQSIVKSRAPLEDNANVVMEYENGVVGTVWACSVNAGAVFGEKIRVIGAKASIEWIATEPNQLKYEIQGEPNRVLERGFGYIYPEAIAEDRIGGGHPEGLFEAWSNLYLRFGMAMNDANQGGTVGQEEFWYPDVRAGYEGVKWVNTCVESANKGSIWIDY